MAETATNESFTPPELAKKWRVGLWKVMGYIKDRKLRALNFSHGKQPRFRILASDVESFEKRIGTKAPPPKPVKRPRGRAKTMRPVGREFF